MFSEIKWRAAVLLQWAILLPAVYFLHTPQPSELQASAQDGKAPSVPAATRLPQTYMEVIEARWRNDPRTVPPLANAPRVSIPTDKSSRLGLPRLPRGAGNDTLLQNNPYHQSGNLRDAGARTPASASTSPAPAQQPASPTIRLAPALVPTQPNSRVDSNLRDDLLHGNPYHTPGAPRPVTTPPAASPKRSSTEGESRTIRRLPVFDTERSDGVGDELLRGNPYHGRTDRSVPEGQESEGSPSDTLTEPEILRPIDVDQEELPAPDQQRDVDADEGEEQAPAAGGDESQDDLFGDLYGDIEADKQEKEQKREERGEDKSDEQQDKDVDPHFELYSKTMYPSAKQCAKCHEQVYKEWAVSSHAYAGVSPMFHKFEQKINALSQGTVGYFCLRCHAPVATAMGVQRDQPLFEEIPAAYEGVTCITCHRVSERYARANGERMIEPGPIFNPVYGASDGSALREVLEKKDHYKVKTSPDEKGPGQEIHAGSFFFDQLNKSEFCVSCHQVAVFPGIKLEVVWEQYRASPACKAGISCQDCHMGTVPGKPSGYARAPGAIVGGKKVNPNRKHANHMFFGPGYSIAHPGIFPFNLKADEHDWSATDWLQFDYRSAWGSKAFEEQIEDGTLHVDFPPVWQDAEDRRDAWDIVVENHDSMMLEREVRTELMETTSHIDGPFFKSEPRCGKPLKFQYQVNNLNSGHNAPSGSLGAQPQIWLNTVLVNPRGERVWESGYTDAIGDVADTLSLEVAAGRCKPDLQLVNFQSKFLMSHVKGTDREWFLPINVDIDQLPFLRPSGLPVTTLNHPPFIRMEQRSLPPLSTYTAKYKVPAAAMRMPGRYRLSVRMRSRSHPVYFVRFCEGTPDMERRINEGMLDFHQDSVEFIVH